MRSHAKQIRNNNDLPIPPASYSDAHHATSSIDLGDASGGLHGSEADVADGSVPNASWEPGPHDQESPAEQQAGELNFGDDDEWEVAGFVDHSEDEALTDDEAALEERWSSAGSAAEQVAAQPAARQPLARGDGAARRNDDRYRSEWQDAGLGQVPPARRRDFSAQEDPSYRETPGHTGEPSQAPAAKSLTSAERKGFVKREQLPRSPYEFGAEWSADADDGAPRWRWDPDATELDSDGAGSERPPPEPRGPSLVQLSTQALHDGGDEVGAALRAKRQELAADYLQGEEASWAQRHWEGEHVEFALDGEPAQDDAHPVWAWHEWPRHSYAEDAVTTAADNAPGAAPAQATSDPALTAFLDALDAELRAAPRWPAAEAAPVATGDAYEGAPPQVNALPSAAEQSGADAAVGSVSAEAQSLGAGSANPAATGSSTAHARVGSDEEAAAGGEPTEAQRESGAPAAALTAHQPHVAGAEAAQEPTEAQQESDAPADTLAAELPGAAAPDAGVAADPCLSEAGAAAPHEPARALRESGAAVDALAAGLPDAASSDAGSAAEPCPSEIGAAAAEPRPTEPDPDLQDFETLSSADVPAAAADGGDEGEIDKGHSELRVSRKVSMLAQFRAHDLGDAWTQYTDSRQRSAPSSRDIDRHAPVNVRFAQKAARGGGDALPPPPKACRAPKRVIPWEVQIDAPPPPQGGYEGSHLPLRKLRKAVLPDVVIRALPCHAAAPVARADAWLLKPHAPHMTARNLRAGSGRWTAERLMPVLHQATNRLLFANASVLAAHAAAEWPDAFLDPPLERNHELHALLERWAWHRDTAGAAIEVARAATAAARDAGATVPWIWYDVGLHAASVRGDTEAAEEFFELLHVRRNLPYEPRIRLRRIIAYANVRTIDQRWAPLPPESPHVDHDMVSLCCCVTPDCYAADQVHARLLSKLIAGWRAAEARLAHCHQAAGGRARGPDHAHRVYLHHAHQVLRALRRLGRGRPPLPCDAGAHKPHLSSLCLCNTTHSPHIEP